MNIKKVLVIAIIATAPLLGMHKKSSKIVRNQEQQEQKKIRACEKALASLIGFMTLGIVCARLNRELGRNPVINQQSPICTVQQPICTVPQPICTVNENRLATFLSHGPAKEVTQCNPLEEIHYLKNAITVKNMEVEELKKEAAANRNEKFMRIEEIECLKMEIEELYEEKDANYKEIFALKQQTILEKVIQKMGL